MPPKFETFYPKICNLNVAKWASMSVKFHEGMFDFVRKQANSL